ncbi:hypothetical protein K438DRAFT_1758029 [Mycena galopus ATCC 62051]|nr:hypothetical protein K438DRAFT_1758029 [Mycena galopus ATCC 62051]
MVRNGEKRSTASAKRRLDVRDDILPARVKSPPENLPKLLLSKHIWGTHLRYLLPRFKPMHSTSMPAVGYPWCAGSACFIPEESAKSNLFPHLIIIAGSGFEAHNLAWSPLRSLGDVSEAKSAPKQRPPTKAHNFLRDGCWSDTYT